MTWIEKTLLLISHYYLEPATCIYGRYRSIILNMVHITCLKACSRATERALDPATMPCEYWRPSRTTAGWITVEGMLQTANKSIIIIITFKATIQVHIVASSICISSFYPAAPVLWKSDWKWKGPVYLSCCVSGAFRLYWWRWENRLTLRP